MKAIKTKLCLGLSTFTSAATNRSTYSLNDSSHPFVTLKSCLFLISLDVDVIILKKLLGSSTEHRHIVEH